jgi:DNA-binding SARP family transcriptional activator
VRVGVIGPVVVDAGEAWTPSRQKERTLIAALVCARPTPLSTDQLADVLWGDRLPANPAKAVQNHVLRIRHALGTDAIRTVHGAYTLAAEATTDVDELTDFVRVGLDAHRAAEDRHAALAAARSLRRGLAYQDLLDWPDASAEVARIEELLCVADEEAFALQLRSEHGGPLIAELRRAARAEPLRERRWSLLVAALRADGRPAEARAALREARTTLREDGAIDPGPELRAHEVALGVEPGPPASSGPLPSRGVLFERVARAWRAGQGRELDGAFVAWSGHGDGEDPLSANRVAVVRSAWLLLHGDVVGARAEADRALALGDAERDPWVSQMHQAQSSAIAREQGCFDQLRPAYEGFASLGIPPVALQRAWLAHGLLLLGAPERAGELLAVDTADDFAAVAADDLRLTILSLYAEVAAATGAARSCAALEAHLIPHESQVVFDGAVCLGAVARYLGAVFAARGAWTEADEQLQRAAEINRRLRAPAWLARSLADRAEVLVHLAGGAYPSEGLITAAIEITARHELVGAAADVARAASAIGFR